MKKLRRSFQTNKSSTSLITEKVIKPPKKVICALQDFKAMADDQLSFQQGDFFHVFGDSVVDVDRREWYDACNPATAIRGLVPADHFQVLGRSLHQQRPGAGATANPASESRHSLQPAYVSLPLAGKGEQPRHERSSSTTAPSLVSTTSSNDHGNSQNLYGVVKYDFQAERVDELDAKAGDTLLIMAQSTEEWFVAKPIAKLGGPGLVPVSYVEIRDVATGEAAEDWKTMLARNNMKIPKIHEWKMMVPDTISPTFAAHSGSDEASPPNGLSLAVFRADLVQAVSVSSCALRNETYVFCIELNWIENLGRNDLNREECSSVTHLIQRKYDDFFHMQVRLLDGFPRDAGYQGSPRIIPYMSAPVEKVTESVAIQRRVELDSYLQQLLQLPLRISGSEPVADFFRIRPETDQIVENRVPYNNAVPEFLSFDSFNLRLHTRSHSDGSDLPASLASESPVATAAANPAETVKVKLCYGGEIVAIRVTPRDFNLSKLAEKVYERFALWNARLSYKKPAGEDHQQTPCLITNDAELIAALASSSKLTIKVEAGTNLPS